MSSKKTVDLLKNIVQYVQAGNGFEKVLKNVSLLRLTSCKFCSV